MNDRRKNQQTGEWEDYPNYVGCVVIGRRAQALSGKLQKGQKVVVGGKLHYSAWETKDGQKRSSLEVIVDDLDFMSAFVESKHREPEAKQPETIFDVEIPF